MSQTADERRVALMALSPTIHVSFRQLVFTFASGQQAYWYAGWNEEGTGKHCSLYLGKEPPDYHPCFNHRCGHAGSKRGPRGKRKLPKAIALLQTLLQSGPRREREVWEALQQSGCSFRTYHRARQELGVEAIRVGLREDGWWELNIPTTTAFFDRWTPELAWVTGLIWGRGCLHGTTVEIHSKDLDLLETVNLLLQQVNGIPPKHRGKTWRIAFSSPQAALWLRSIGMAEAKSFTRDWPIGLPAELVGHFVRGLMDGKGAIGQYFKHPGQQTGNLVVSLAGTGQALCQTLTQWLDAHALHYSGPMNQPTWRITIKRQASLRILYHLLYPTTEVPCLQRKRAPYIHWIEQERIRRGRPKKGVKEMGAGLTRR